MAVESGQRIKAYMEREGLSQRTLAKKIQMRGSTMGKALKGEVEIPKDKEEVLEIALQVPSGDIVEFSLSFHGVPNAQIEHMLKRPLRDLDDIRKNKIKTITRGQTVIKYRT